MADEDKLQNNAVQQFRRNTLNGLKQAARKFSKGKTKSMVQRGQQSNSPRTELKLVESLKSKVRKNGGAIESVSFPFERHGVFVVRGVSSKHPVGDPRNGEDWIKPTFDKQAPDLADKLAEINGNNVIRIRE